MNTNGPSDYFKPGAWNAACDMCGRKFKSDELRKNWRGLMVCLNDYETRHPQDFVKAARPEKQIPWSRPKPDPYYAPACYPNDRISIPGLMVPGCALPSFIDPSNTLGY